MTEAELLADLREVAFGRLVVGGPPRIGAEAELIPIDVATGRVAPIRAADRPSTLPVLRRVAERLGWREEEGDAPKFHTSGGALVAYEPGGQIEVSTPPETSVHALMESLQETVLPLRDAALAAGVRLLEEGIDPVSTITEVPLQLGGERYRLMDQHFARIGPAGARMMRQTASFQVNIDWADDVALHWRVLNAAAPFLTAIFASSPLYRGADTGAQSFRALTWTELDPGRTGVVGGTGDPALAYLRFALAAPAILTPTPGGAIQPFGTLLRTAGATREDWRAHLTTLFPEVRPKGYAEVRCIDAVPAQWYAAPLALLSGLAHPEGLDAAAALLPAPDAALIVRAARRGLRDADIAETAAELFRIALEGARLAGEGWVDTQSLATARDYLDRYTRRRRAPADEIREQGVGLFSPAEPLDFCR
ncbi:MAG: hypothetical protein KY464_11645 [Gemmatimonadetes bacterium]|nr:hypothetical protein [Gemmatimonadota bacterium]